MTTGKAEQQMADALGVDDGRMWTMVGLQQVARTLRERIAALEIQATNHKSMLRYCEGHHQERIAALEAERDTAQHWFKAEREITNQLKAENERLRKHVSDLADELLTALKYVPADAPWRSSAEEAVDDARAALAGRKR